MSSTNNKNDTTLMLGAVAASAAVSSIMTYYATKRITETKLEEKLVHFEARKRRASSVNLEVIEELKKLDEKGGGAEKEKEKLLGTKIPDASVDDIYIWEVEHLANLHESGAKDLVNTMHRAQSKKKPTFFTASSTVDDDSDGETDKKMRTDYNQLIGTHECVLADIVRKPGQTPVSRAFVRAGPRSDLHFDPEHVNAAIVTCGGLCPGLNNVIREITNSLVHLYDVRGKIWGIRGGYKGFYDHQDYPPMELTPDVVDNIHHIGGTVLASSRGGFDLDKIVKFIQDFNISQLYVIGGDGTHRGAFRIHEGCMEKGLNVSVAGIPKTIDNDVDHIDRSFGFASAVESAQAAIRVAKTEATCNLPNGIGIVKLMGRSAGFIAVHATLGSGDVDLCLVPEVPIVLEGPNGCLPHLMRRVQEQGFAVVVVAEGAGEELLGESAESDKSGNRVLPKIGEFLKKTTEEYFQKHGKDATIKYIDPSYMIRSVPANAADALYCMQLAQNAVHGAMSGFTGFSVGLCNNKMVLLPIPVLVATSPRMMNPTGRTWERILSSTRQPNTVVTKESF